mmetsp:Transcript_53882/g.64836  ORF Transcript_53882/g.64836 Transcript_53882/m.64836 type:complete len:89 (+) Transcript_53882:66-332(+)
MQSAVGLIPDMRACTSSSVVNGRLVLVGVKSDKCGGFDELGSKSILFRRMRSQSTLQSIIQPKHARDRTGIRQPAAFNQHVIKILAFG